MITQSRKRPIFRSIWALLDDLWAAFQGQQTVLQQIANQQNHMDVALLEIRTRLMATFKEVQDSLEKMRAEVARDTDAANAASTAMHTMADQLKALSASATDFDSLKSDIDSFSGTIHQNADNWAAAIVQNTDAGGGTPSGGGTPGGGGTPDAGGTVTPPVDVSGDSGSNPDAGGGAAPVTGAGRR